jgi:hypothetical protein
MPRKALAGTDFAPILQAALQSVGWEGIAVTIPTLRVQDFGFWERGRTTS